MVDDQPVGRRRGEFVTVECSVVPRDKRPRLCVLGRFAGDVLRIKLLEGGVDVGGVENYGAKGQSHRQ